MYFQFGFIFTKSFTKVQKYLTLKNAGQLAVAFEKTLLGKAGKIRKRFSSFSGSLHYSVAI